MVDNCITNDVLNRIDIGILILNDQFEISFWNDYLKELTGYSLSEVDGHKLSDIYELFSRDIYQSFLKDVLTKEQNIFCSNTLHDTFIEAADKREIKQNMLMEHISFQKKDFVLIQIIDVTNQVKRVNALKKEKKRAKQANRAKSEFLANMSHEIRTPLNAVIGFSQILEDKLEANKYQEYLNSIKSASNSLLNLLDDILDMSKIEADMLEVKLNYFKLNDLLKEIDNIFYNKVRNKGLELISDVNIKELKIKFDENKLRQILINLIGNAVKFTQEGYIRIIVNKTIKNNQQLDLELIVEDTGVGIDKNNQEKIFESFTQQDGQSTREYGGTGLGLTITKKLTELLGGEINLVSQVGKGSRFILTFYNLEYKDIDKVERPPKSSKEIEFETAKILVVDDVESNRKFLKVKLESKGLKVVEAKDGQQAIELVQSQKFALIIMDLKMPIMDGYQTLKEIRSRDYQMPIIAFTASATTEEKENVKRAGFDNFLTKPVSSDKLVKIVAKYLNYTKKSKDINNEQRLEVDSTKLNQKIIDRLEKDFLAKNKKIKDIIIINEVESFVDDLYKFGKANKLNSIINYATRLEEDLNSFNLDKIEERVSEFETLFKNLKEEFEGVNKDG